MMIKGVEVWKHGGTTCGYVQKWWIVAKWEIPNVAWTTVTLPPPQGWALVKHSYQTCWLNWFWTGQGLVRKMGCSASEWATWNVSRRSYSAWHCILIPRWLHWHCILAIWPSIRHIHSRPWSWGSFPLWTHHGPQSLWIVAWLDCGYQSYPHGRG